MPHLLGFAVEPEHQAGVLFKIHRGPLFDRKIALPEGDIELRREQPYILAGLRPTSDSETPDQMFSRAHSLVNAALDVLSVEWRDSLVVVNPTDHIRWYPIPNGLKVSVRSSIVFRPAMQLSPCGVDANAPISAVQPDAPALRAAYRYFRYSQATDRLYEAYRNVFLAFECLLDDLHPYRDANQQGETEWLKVALRKAILSGQVDLALWKSEHCADGINAFVERHYNAVRCALFHAKTSREPLFLPGDFHDSETVVAELPLIQNIVEKLLRLRSTARLSSSGTTEAGVEAFLAPYAAHVKLVVIEDGPEACSGGEPPAILLPVTYLGKDKQRFGEWRFRTDVRCSDYSLRRIAAGVLAGPRVEGLYELMGNEMRDTYVVERLELDGVTKIEVIVSCLLRNPMDQRKHFLV